MADVLNCLTRSETKTESGLQPKENKRFLPLGHAVEVRVEHHQADQLRRVHRKPEHYARCGGTWQGQQHNCINLMLNTTHLVHQVQ